GEKAFEEEDWAFLFKAGYGEASPEDARPIDYLKLGFGFKYYLMALTSLEATGEVIAYDFDLDNDTVSAGVGIKHRFVPAGKGVAPYARAALQYRENYSFDNSLPEADDLRDLVFTFGGGVEFKMSESLSMVFDLVYSESEPTDDDFDDLDGVSGYLGLQYYWFE
ncbi:MAG: hypothetical protein GWM98_09420, partial [Nitrospinaceae bacterium]|nr:hypothetical protein [Nitrospinaceae bacterium]